MFGLFAVALELETNLLCGNCFDFDTRNEETTQFHIRTVGGEAEGGETGESGATSIMSARVLTTATASCILTII